MKQVELASYGTRNPDAPEELGKFDFLIGEWRGEGVFTNEDGTHSPYQVNWVGRYILDGYAIADDARVYDDEGTLTALFITYRFFDRDGKRWIVEVFNGLESTLFSQAPDDLGGVQLGEGSITWLTRGPSMIGRESFLNITGDRFTYRMDVSTDEGTTWTEGVDRIEANRIRD